MANSYGHKEERIVFMHPDLYGIRYEHSGNEYSLLFSFQISSCQILPRLSVFGMDKSEDQVLGAPVLSLLRSVPALVNLFTLPVLFSLPRGRT